MQPAMKAQEQEQEQAQPACWRQAQTAAGARQVAEMQR
jgi:hypothetical protein